jgi:hypothetical protein
MIIEDKTQELPAEWTDQMCDQLISHSMDLGHHGNPSGFLLATSLDPFIGYEKDGEHYLRDKWDYEGIRQWIAENPERVKRVWQLQVKLI